MCPQGNHVVIGLVGLIAKSQRQRARPGRLGRAHVVCGLDKFDVELYAVSWVEPFGRCA